MKQKKKNKNKKPEKKKKTLAGSWMLFDVHAPNQIIWNFQYIFHQKINKII